MKKSKSIAFGMLFSMSWMFAACGSSSSGGDETPVQLKVTPAAIALPSTSVITVTTDGEWDVASDRAWCQCSPVNGKGNGTITLTIKEENQTGTDVAKVTVTCGKLTGIVTVTQGTANGVPSLPVLTSPALGAQGVSVFPEFEWSASEDPEGTAITYVVSYSKDATTWKTSKDLTTCRHVVMDGPLAKQTTYSWKVTAKDKDGRESTSAVGTFTTGNVGGYMDGESQKYLTHTAGRGIRLVFVGDGFLPKHFEEGGYFDTMVKEGVEGFFSFEPFKTYKKYFDVYKIAAYSEESGVTDENTTMVKNTRFDVRFVESPSMVIGKNSTGDKKVHTFVRQALKIEETDLLETIVILVANENRYGGACYMNTEQKNIAICAYSKQMQDPTGSVYGSFVNIIAHEAGGHAIGSLDEEYWDGHENEMITSDKLSVVQKFQSLNLCQNISLTDDRGKVGWKDFFGREGYEEVGMYPGGAGYEKGVWRAEEKTCMDNNALYYSAPGRMAIVRRILRLAGEGDITLEEFIKNDFVRKYSEAPKVPTVQ